MDDFDIETLKLSLNNMIDGIELFIQVVLYCCIDGLY